MRNKSMAILIVILLPAFFMLLVVNLLADEGDDEYEEVYGIVEAFRANLLGEWIVSGVAYTATIETQFEQEDGPFIVGGCVEVAFVPETNTAVEIGTTDADDCEDEEEPPAEESFYGFVESLPDDLIGLWIIEGVEFVATETTEFDDDEGAFAIGVCVKVKYAIGDGINQAIEIETE